MIRTFWLDRLDEKYEFRVGDDGKANVKFYSPAGSKPWKMMTVEAARELYRELVRSGWEAW